MGAEEHEESGGQCKEDYIISRKLFACDHYFTTAITFSLIALRELLLAIAKLKEHLRSLGNILICFLARVK